MSESKALLKPKFTIKGFIALTIAILMFSGLMANFTNGWRAMDFLTLVGNFGKIGDAGDFVGKGGAGARQGFLFALSLLPTTMAALGFVNVVEYFGGLDTAAFLLSKILRFVLGIPGVCGLTMVTSIGAGDGGAALTLDLHQRGYITDEERDIFAAWQFPASGMVNNFFSSGAAVFPYLAVSIGPCLLVVFLLKFVGANLYRFLIANPAIRKAKMRGDDQNG